MQIFKYRIIFVSSFILKQYSNYILKPKSSFVNSCCILFKKKILEYLHLCSNSTYICSVITKSDPMTKNIYTSLPFSGYTHFPAYLSHFTSRLHG